jgi:PKD repeat protein
MQAVGLYANLTSNGAPIRNSVVAVEVDYPGSGSWQPILLRSIKSISNPSESDNYITVYITPVNINWVPQTGFETGTEAYFNVTLINRGSSVTGLLAWSVLDAASAPLGADGYGSPENVNTFYSGETTVLASSSIPSWATVGTATIYVNLFTNAPSVGGYPIINETSRTFQITSSFGSSAKAIGSIKSQSLEFGSTSTDPSGLYNVSFRVPPDPLFGTYVAYAAALNTTPTDSSAAFQVKAASESPVASFTYSPSAPYVNGTVYFDASSSYSYNGTITNYSWNWGDGSKSPTNSLPTITHVFKAQGTYTVTLNVTDSQNLWGTSQEQVSVSGPTSPVANFTFFPDPTWIKAGTEFNAASSTPGWNGTGNPPIVSYIWNYGDGTKNTSSSAVTYHRFTTTGTFFVTLTVKDMRGWNGTAGQNVQVEKTGESPHAGFVIDSPPIPYVDGAVVFDASSSFSYYGTIVNYKWNWGDGSPEQSTSYYVISHTFTSAGTFDVTLNVTDSFNLTSGNTVEPVQVLPTTPPVASFTVTPNPTWVNATTKFNATASTPGWNGTGNPPIVSYIWNFGDGTNVTTSSKVTSHQFKTLGNFYTTLTVKDTRGWNGTTAVGIDVANVTLRVDVAVTGVGFAAPPKGLYQIARNYYQPYQGWAGNISVTVLNNGTTAQSFSVTVSYSNGTFHSLGTQHVTNLASLASTVLVYPWNTSLLEPTMNYTITANATILAGETNPQSEQYSIIARVKGPGDVNGDGVVNGLDLHIIAVSWLKTVPPGDPRADILGDGTVNGLDLHVVARSWLKSYG